MDKKNIGLRGMWDKVRNWWLGSKAEPHVKAPVRFTNFLLLAFAGKSRRDYVTLPNNFDLKRFKTQYPPENYGFRHGIVFRDFKVLYILHLLSSIPGRNSDLISESGFIPIHTPTLQRHMRDYNLYLELFCKYRCIGFVNGVVFQTVCAEVSLQTFLAWQSLLQKSEMPKDIVNMN